MKKVGTILSNIHSKYSARDLGKKQEKNSKYRSPVLGNENCQIGFGPKKIHSIGLRFFVFLTWFFPIGQTLGA